MAFEKWDPQPEFERFPASATIVQSRLIRLPTPVASMLRLRGKIEREPLLRQEAQGHRHPRARQKRRRRGEDPSVRQVDLAARAELLPLLRHRRAGHQTLSLLVRREGADGDDRHLASVAARTTGGNVASIREDRARNENGRPRGRPSCLERMVS